ncbi:hypothetical protein D041_4278A, partial [Vibrio parahaemolyticus EKP-008]
MLGFCT